MSLIWPGNALGFPKKCCFSSWREGCLGLSHQATMMTDGRYLNLLTMNFCETPFPKSTSNSIEKTHSSMKLQSPLWFSCLITASVPKEMRLNRSLECSQKSTRSSISLQMPLQELSAAGHQPSRCRESMKSCQCVFSKYNSPISSGAPLLLLQKHQRAHSEQVQVWRLSGSVPTLPEQRLL